MYTRTASATLPMSARTSARVYQRRRPASRAGASTSVNMYLLDGVGPGSAFGVPRIRGGVGPCSAFGIFGRAPAVEHETCSDRLAWVLCGVACAAVVLGGVRAECEPAREKVDDRSDQRRPQVPAKKFAPAARPATSNQAHGPTHRTEGQTLRFSRQEMSVSLMERAGRRATAPVVCDVLDGKAKHLCPIPDPLADAHLFRQLLELPVGL